ncbi:MAG: sulfide/dihydroorotate dehydrogenase-like FAD/NAD-binding protein [Bacilli bacterium]|nr:sulfide/dihydroorotate dehydrogenase-like FAD/NAD-binding protein [Bacilli bacterium]
MYKVLENKKLKGNSYLMVVEAPLLIKNALPGQFVIVMAYSDSERIPLTIYDYDKTKGTVSLIYQVVGASTDILTTVKDELFSIAGPLGNANEICKNPDEYRNRRIVYVAGGVGIAPVYPQVKYLKNCGFDIDVIYGARSADLFLIRDQIEAVSKKVRYATDDGSFGTKGFVTDVLEKYHEDYDLCVAIGPVIMMKSVSELTKKYGIQTIVSMNPLMVDGSGMCGACRCEVDGKPKFACIHGPEFDGHKVDFSLALKRMNIYKEEEKAKWEERLKQVEGAGKDE